MIRIIQRYVLLALALIATGAPAQDPGATADAWPQWGRTSARNNVAGNTHLPVQWDLGKFDAKSGQWQGSADKQIRWVARLGSETYGSPVIAADKVFCATNNGAGYLARYPKDVDLGCLLCFAQYDGRFLWQFSSAKLAAGRAVDWPQQGICSCPIVEGSRLWIVTNRGEVVCLDTEAAREGQHEARVVWRFDMMRQLGSVQRYMASCAATVAGDLLFCGTSNGVDSEGKLTAPQAPSFIALDKNTGKLVWSAATPGENILEGQWSSPAVAVLGGVPQVLFGGGDGWLYSFGAAPTADGKPQLLWKFDCNPKDARWESGGSGRRNYLIASPVICDGRVYIGTGQDPEAGEGLGDLWCIDPTRRGDVSPEIVVDKAGQPVPPRRLQAVDAAAGEQVRPNPNSAAVWHYRGSGGTTGKSDDFKHVMHRTLGLSAVHDGLLVTADFTGLIHCLDARTGQVYWTHDLLSAVWGSPLVADGKLYLGDEDGDVVVMEFGKQEKVLAKNSMGAPVFGTPAVVDHSLVIATRTHLAAIGGGK